MQSLVDQHKPLKDAMDALNQEVVRLGYSIYSQPSQPGVRPAFDTATGKTADGDDVIEAYFTC
jgi:hypothetical protein